MPNFENFSLITIDGIKLHGQEWICDYPKAMICMVHGLGEHIGRYRHVAKHFNDNNIVFYAMDLRGHGQSRGKRGHTPSFEHLLDDVERLLMYARAEHNDLPLFLYGHSLGGNIVSNYVLNKNTNELRGAIISSPWLKLVRQLSYWEKSLVHFASKIFPSFTQSNKLDTGFLTSDTAVNKTYADDPLVQNKISVKMFLECDEAGRIALRKAETNKISFYIFHGDSDEITSEEASKQFAYFAGGDNIKYRKWKKTKHEPHNDVNKEEVLASVTEWVFGRL